MNYLFYSKCGENIWDSSWCPRYRGFYRFLYRHIYRFCYTVMSSTDLGGPLRAGHQANRQAVKTIILPSCFDNLEERFVLSFAYLLISVTLLLKMKPVDLQYHFSYHYRYMHI